MPEPKPPPPPLPKHWMEIDAEAAAARARDEDEAKPTEFFDPPPQEVPRETPRTVEIRIRSKKVQVEESILKEAIELFILSLLVAWAMGSLLKLFFPLPS